MLPDEHGEAKKEKKKMKEAAAAKKGSSIADLEQMILAKQNNFGGFLNYMTAKYGAEEEVVGKKKR